MGIIYRPFKVPRQAGSMTPFNTQTVPKVSAANLLVLTAAFISVLLFSLPRVFPHATTYLTALRYPKCGHIVLVSCQRHGSTWFISNVEGCTAMNGSYGDLSPMVEIWHHGKVKDISLEGAIDLIRFNTSVKIMPTALLNEREKLKAFFESIREMEVPVFVLRRQLDQSFASLQEAWKSKLWNADNGGRVFVRDVKENDRFWKYKNRTETFFKDAKTIMREVGIVWDEVEYEKIVLQRFIAGEKAKCYIRNCNF